MATPVVQAHTGSGGTNNGATSAPLPSGIQNGDTLFLFFNLNNGLLDTPAGWTKIVDYSFADVLSLSPHVYAFVRDADGTEGTSVALTWVGGNLKWSSFAYRISGSDASANWTLSTEHTASSTTADANSLSPPGGAKDYLWIYFGGSQNAYTVASPATGYTDLESQTSAGSGSANSKSTSWACTKSTTAATTENPPAWTVAGTGVGHAEWVIAIPPAAPATPVLPKRIRLPVGMTQAVHRAAVR